VGVLLLSLLFWGASFQVLADKAELHETKIESETVIVFL
jgi:hypothetical protein